MRLWSTLACLAVVPVLAGQVSYVVLNQRGAGTLIRIDSAGTRYETIATVPNGSALALDRNGDYLVATDTPGPLANSALLRVTRWGVVSKIADAPPESGWVAVTVDESGNALLVDNRTHSIWRVPASGGVPVRVCGYAAPEGNANAAGIIAEKDGGLTFALDVGSNGLFKIDPAGSMTAVRPLDALSGVHVPVFGSRITPDGEGGHFLVSYRSKRILHLTAAGALEKLAEVPGQNMTGIARNPQTGELVVTLNFSNALIRVSADGKLVAPLGSAAAYVSFPGDIVAEVRE